MIIYIYFHTVGPIIYDEVTDKEIKELQECYINSLNLAKENKIRTIAFPCISTGEFRFPKEEASKIAIESVDRFLNENREYFDKVVFNVYKEEDYKIYERNS
ncbi:MAG TPA: macro domain-containing protein [Candidatus Scatovivens faecipullorum]|nr:macro domain-containing protein [Candidatus Scatovivens faecipullorum]